MKRVTLAIASMLLMSSMGVAFADTQPQNAVLQVTPVVLGLATGRTAHTVNVRTSTGESMTFEYDSRTVMPLDLDDQTHVRVEFKLTDSGLHLAQRITRVGPGSADWDVIEQHAEAPMSDDDRVVAGNRTMDDNEAMNADHHEMNADHHAMDADHHEMNADNHDMNAEHHDMSDADRKDEMRERASSTGGDDRAADAQLASNAGHDTDDKHEKMPSTASELPWVLSLGLLALAGSAWLVMRRRRRSV